MNERKGIPAGSAPPPVNYNSYQSSQIQARKNTTSGELKKVVQACFVICIGIIDVTINIVHKCKTTCNNNNNTFFIVLCLLSNII